MNLDEFRKAMIEAQNIIKDAKTRNFINDCENDILQTIKFSVFASYATGKSTFLNALLFENDILHTGLGETTRGAISIHYGDKICYEINNEKNVCTDLQQLKSLIQENNNEAAQEQKSFEAKIKVNLPKMRDLIVFDTPGFGSLNENELEKMITKACEDTDGIIFIFDISKGITQNDIDSIKKYLKGFDEHLPQLTRWIIFNKLDIDDEYPERYLCDFMSKQLVKLDLLKKEEQTNYDSFDKLAAVKTFAVSSKKHLKAQMPNDHLNTVRRKELIEKSKIRYFETHFYNELPKTKVVKFKEDISKWVDLFDIEIKHYNDRIIANEERINKHITLNQMSVENKNAYLNHITQAKDDFSEQVNNYKSQYQLLEANFRAKPFHDLTTNITRVLHDKVMASLGNFRLIGGDSAEELVKKGVANAKPAIERYIKAYLGKILKKPLEIVTHTEVVIHVFNNNSDGIEIKSLNTTLKGKLLYLDKAIKEIGTKLKQNLTPNILQIDKVSNAEVSKKILQTVGGMILSSVVSFVVLVVAGMIVEIVVSRILSLLIPIIGWILGFILVAWSIFGGKTVAERLQEKVEPELKKILPGEIKKIMKQELYSRFTKGIIKDMKTIVDQIKKYIDELDVSYSVANNDLVEAEKKLKEMKYRAQDKNKGYREKLDVIEDYKSRLDSIINGSFKKNI